MKKKFVNIEILSQYRSLLMGMSILGIVFCHYHRNRMMHGLPDTFLSGILASATSFVDVFMLLSSFGLYYSLEKSNDIKCFYKKRILRLLPAYVLVAGAYWIYCDLIDVHGSLGRFFYDFFFVSWITEDIQRFWFIGAILVFYFIFPLIYAFFKKNEHTGLFVIVLWGGVILTGVLIMNFTDWSVYRNIRIGVERFPIFVLGAYLGKKSVENKPINTLWLIFVCLFTLCIEVYNRWDFLDHIKIISIPHYLNTSMLALTFTIVVVYLFQRIRNYKIASVLKKCFVSLGSITLEAYLLHVALANLFGLPPYFGKYIAVCVILPLILAYILHFAIQNFWSFADAHKK